MNIGLDTSVVLRLLIGEPEHQARSALHHLEEARRAHKQIFVSDLVMSESYFALQHHYGVPKQTALRALRELLGSHDIIVTAQGCALEVLQTPRLASAKLDRATVLKARADR